MSQTGFQGVEGDVYIRGLHSNSEKKEINFYGLLLTLLSPLKLRPFPQVLSLFKLSIVIMIFANSVILELWLQK